MVIFMLLIHDEIWYTLGYIICSEVNTCTWDTITLIAMR